MFASMGNDSIAQICETKRRKTSNKISGPTEQILNSGNTTRTLPYFVNLQPENKLK